MVGDRLAERPTVLRERLVYLATRLHGLSRGVAESIVDSHTAPDGAVAAAEALRTIRRSVNHFPRPPSSAVLDGRDLRSLMALVDTNSTPSGR